MGTEPVVVLGVGAFADRDWEVVRIGFHVVSLRVGPDVQMIDIPYNRSQHSRCRLYRDSGGNEGVDRGIG